MIHGWINGCYATYQSKGDTNIISQVNYVVQEAIVVIRDIFRKYPGKRLAGDALGWGTYWWPTTATTVRFIDSIGKRTPTWSFRLKLKYIVISCNFCMLVPTRGWQCEEMLHPPFGFQCQLLLNCRYEIIISDLCENLDSLDEPDAKAAMIWIVGEYAERSPAGWHMVTCTCVRFAGVPIDQKTELAEQLSLETRNQGKDCENSGTVQFSVSYQVLTVVCFVLMSLHFYCVDVGNSHIAVIPTLLANSLLLSITFL